MHFTSVLAGFAFTNTSLPKAIRFPALVAGFFFSLIIVIPGRVNFPVAFSCAGISDSKDVKTAFTSFFFTPEEDSIAPKISLFGMALPFTALLTRFIAFMAGAAFMAFAGALTTFIAFMAGAAFMAFARALTTFIAFMAGAAVFFAFAFTTFIAFIAGAAAFFAFA